MEHELPKQSCSIGHIVPSQVFMTYTVFPAWLNGGMLAVEGLSRTGSLAVARRRVGDELCGLLLASLMVCMGRA